MIYTIASDTCLKRLTRTRLIHSCFLMPSMLLEVRYKIVGGSLMEPCDHAADLFAIREFYPQVTNAYMV